MAGTVRVIARIRTRRERETTVEVALKQLIAPSRAEPGCLRYELYRGVEDRGLFLIDEEWASEAALDAHAKSPHITKVLAEAGPFLAEPPEIVRYRAAGLPPS
jgi:quinol monooxygenase YgiN